MNEQKMEGLLELNAGPIRKGRVGINGKHANKTPAALKKLKNRKKRKLNKKSR